MKHNCVNRGNTTYISMIKYLLQSIFNVLFHPYDWKEDGLMAAILTQ